MGILMRMQLLRLSHFAAWPWKVEALICSFNSLL